jgi:hypothetical protein
LKLKRKLNVGRSFMGGKGVEEGFEVAIAVGGGEE